MELEMNKCILCADTAQERKYFFKGEPLCFMHYAEYLDVMIEDKEYTITSDDSTSAFEKYKLTLEPTPLSESKRKEKAREEHEDKERAKREEEKKKTSYSAPSPHNNSFNMGM